MAAAGGYGFCVVARRLVMVLAFLTVMVDGGLDDIEGRSFRNSKSRMCTSMNYLDTCSLNAMSDEHDGIAGLALHSLCMLPWNVDERDMRRSVAHHPDACREPNRMLRMPKHVFECLAGECNDSFMEDMLHGEMRRDWQFKVTQRGNSLETVFHPSMSCLNLQNHFHYHSGILNSVATFFFRREMFSLSFVRVCNFQCNAGNFNSVSHRAIVGNFMAWFVRYWKFQCNTVKCNFSVVHTPMEFAMKLTWPMMLGVYMEAICIHFL